ncbi:MAG: transcription elongation factor GreA [Candidatus Pacebacteria bacterium]|nr:transcription elongation factor GreA [Candidatus Paceibacterota bacterium]
MTEYLSQQKYKEFVDELDYLQTTRRQEIAESLKEARSLGDLSENAEYHQAREDQANIEKRITDLQAILEDTTIVKKSSSSEVSIGVTVVVQKKGDKEKKEYTIVGNQESDMEENKISVSSPLVKAMLGKSKGESFCFESPKGKQEYKVINIK